ncbi:MAG TPA: helix-turn-helix domain-containing protein [Flavisolibacter sp.]|nr:helix-turn-helix domain-containing protein [Flavisolibacter sp.]
MLFLPHTPHPALGSLIDCFFLMHIQVDEGQQPIICPFPPTPLQFIVFYLDDLVIAKKEGEAGFTTRARCIVVGAQATRVNLLVRKSHKCFVIGFHPGGLYRLLGIPMKELYDDGFDGREVAGSELECLTQQLQEASSFAEMVGTAEQYFLKKLGAVKNILPFDEAMKVLAKHNGAISMEQMASLSCLSLRQFERKCHERIGYSPKFFARIARFSRAYRLRESRPGLSWTAIAHESGYFDQMHFIRDFKQFASLTPTGMAEQIAANPFPMQAPLKL